MNAYRPTSNKTRFAIAALTLVLSAALLETVAGSMLFPDPAAEARRHQVLADQGERAQALRELENRSVRVAVTTSTTRI